MAMDANCGSTATMDGFRNDDERLREAADSVVAARAAAGLNGLVGDLAAVVINTESDRQGAAAEQLVRRTGYSFHGGFENETARGIVLRCPDSADILINARRNDHNPFVEFNLCPKSSHLPNTRLETFVFETSNLEAYVAIQKGRGLPFLTDNIVCAEHFAFIQTPPSRYTGNALGFIQWTGERGNYTPKAACGIDETMGKPDLPCLANIGVLDHAATRLHAESRDPAILEFMNYTEYCFQFAIYVDGLNSITNVSRLKGAKFALVFTSGIEKPEHGESLEGPTERFVHNYGLRVHHLAFITEHIEETYDALRADGQGFLSNLVGSPEEGIKQAFSDPSEHTLLVNEYIMRYGDFDGFFTKSNVAALTRATENQ
jgi:hypothetical protein